MTEMTHSPIAELNERSREIFKRIVESYFETGEPVGSRTLSRVAGMDLSPATIRNVMADLVDAGLLFAPHTSAGRLPTEAGLRLFVHGILEIGDLAEHERSDIEAQCAGAGKSLEQVLDQASRTLSGLSGCAGVVSSPKSESRLRHLEFVNLAPGRALVVMVMDNGLVENRVVSVPLGMPATALTEATNYLSARLAGRTLGQARAEIAAEIEQHKTQLDALTEQIVEAGLATWSGDGDTGTLILRGHAHLLDDVTALDDIERVRALFDMLEREEGYLRLVEAAQHGEGVQIFIGAENELFNHAGCAMIVAPYRDRSEHIIGAIGVVGPTRINYARIVPMVDHTAKVVGKLLG
ncbi:MAG: heat-inducible transcriptional repressor HrcA [Alphaproteobacteria bacterium]|nr:heat-inducible transcriptional repressor HrcA [Alphaproteobacteria bacterium]